MIDIRVKAGLDGSNLFRVRAHTGGVDLVGEEESFAATPECPVAIATYRTGDTTDAQSEEVAVTVDEALDLYRALGIALAHLGVVSA